ncbi:acyl-CoA dehydrogenase family protein [Ottowia thiooxydans]|uniref:Alkylation response protein AidB-like acyl-CoA dehydrogenase n=1 Tax=Ottowia thiooxydans TaxID=219182 RepID=A0ABV2Q1M7_9BURK
MTGTHSALKALEDEIRSFARTQCPTDLRRKVALHKKIGRSELAFWQASLNKKGWGALDWPKAHGGAEWDIASRFLFERVMAEENCPVQYHHGIRQIGPVLIRFGNDAQRQRYLPRILSGEEWWCQGYSEPQAGSDLAALSMRAVPDGKHYVVNGQKIWTSHAHESDMMYALVRTAHSGKRQEGISMLLVPLSLPGIEVRPIHTIDGMHHVNEVFFTDVRVPRENLVGTEHQGWTYARYLLDRERLGGTAAIPRLVELIRHLASLLKEKKSWLGEPSYHTIRLRLDLAWGEIDGVSALATQVLEDARLNRPLGANPSILRLTTTLLHQRLTEIGVELDGLRNALLFKGFAESADRVEWMAVHAFGRSKTIAGGTSEIQRTVIARELNKD